MASPEIETSFCTAPGCNNGKVLNLNGILIDCCVCHGTGWINLGDICFCGESCNFLKDGILYCGDGKCLTALKARKANPPRYFQQRYQYYPGIESGVGLDGWYGDN